MCRTYMAVRTSGYITFFIGTPVGNTCIQQSSTNSLGLSRPVMGLLYAFKKQNYTKELKVTNKMAIMRIGQGICCNITAKVF